MLEQRSSMSTEAELVAALKESAADARLNMSPEELGKFSEAMKSSEFRDALMAYMQDLQDPKAREEQETYISELEARSEVPAGMRLIRPTALFALKTYCTGTDATPVVKQVADGKPRPISSPPSVAAAPGKTVSPLEATAAVVATRSPGTSLPTGGTGMGSVSEGEARERDKVFINIVVSGEVGKPEIEATSLPSGKAGRSVVLPHMISPPRHEFDAKEVRTLTFDVCFHPDVGPLCDSSPEYKKLACTVAIESVAEKYASLFPAAPTGTKAGSTSAGAKPGDSSAGPLRLQKEGYVLLKKTKCIGGKPAVLQIKADALPVARPSAAAATATATGSKGSAVVSSGTGVKAGSTIGTAAGKGAAASGKVATTKPTTGTTATVPVPVPQVRRTGSGALILPPDVSLIRRGVFAMSDHMSASMGQLPPTHPKELVLRIALPLLPSAKGVDCDIQADMITLRCPPVTASSDALPPALARAAGVSGSESCMVAYELEYPLPFHVLHESPECNAKFDKDKRTLTLTLPVEPPAVSSGLGIGGTTAQPQGRSLVQEMPDDAITHSAPVPATTHGSGVEAGVVRASDAPTSVGGSELHSAHGRWVTQRPSTTIPLPGAPDITVTSVTTSTTAGVMGAEGPTSAGQSGVDMQAASTTATPGSSASNSTTEQPAQTLPSSTQLDSAASATTGTTASTTTRTPAVRIEECVGGAVPFRWRQGVNTVSLICDIPHVLPDTTASTIGVTGTTGSTTGASASAGASSETSASTSGVTVSWRDVDTTHPTLSLIVRALCTPDVAAASHSASRGGKLPPVSAPLPVRDGVQEVYVYTAEWVLFGGVNGDKTRVHLSDDNVAIVLHKRGEGMWSTLTREVVVVPHTVAALATSATTTASPTGSSKVATSSQDSAGDGIAAAAPAMSPVSKFAVDTTGITPAELQERLLTSRLVTGKSGNVYDTDQLNRALMAFIMDKDDFPVHPRQVPSVLQKGS